jgi:hypothetical protein
MQIAYLLYVDDVRTSQETHILASKASYGDSFTFLHVNDVRIWKETHTIVHSLLRVHSFY